MEIIIRMIGMKVKVIMIDSRDEENGDVGALNKMIHQGGMHKSSKEIIIILMIGEKVKVMYVKVQLEGKSC